MALMLALAISALASAAQEVVPLTRGHSHNDYFRKRPLLDALDHGICSVEADVYLVDGQILLGHDLKDVKPERTLQVLYLDSLRERANANGGRVFPGGPSITLLVDIKSDGPATYEKLRQVFEGYKDILTSFTNDSTTEGAVTVVISGACPTEMVLADSPRLAGVDGRPADLEEHPNPHTHPLISASWMSEFSWKGAGPFPEADAAKLKAMVEKAHANGQRLRFWEIPIRPEAWSILYDAGVDLINADFPDRLQKFLLEKRAAGK